MSVPKISFRTILLDGSDGFLDRLAIGKAFVIILETAGVDELVAHDYMRSVHQYLSAVNSLEVKLEGVAYIR